MPEGNGTTGVRVGERYAAAVGESKSGWVAAVRGSWCRVRRVKLWKKRGGGGTFEELDKELGFGMGPVHNSRAGEDRMNTVGLGLL
jgi:hypothetical protein